MVRTETTLEYSNIFIEKLIFVCTFSDRISNKNTAFKNFILPFPDDPGHVLHQLGYLRLGDLIARPDAGGLDLDVLRHDGGEDDDRQILRRRILLDAASQGKPVQAGHLDVGHQYVEMRPLLHDRIVGLPAVRAEQEIRKSPHREGILDLLADEGRILRRRQARLQKLRCKTLLSWVSKRRASAMSSG